MCRIIEKRLSRMGWGKDVDIHGEEVRRTKRDYPYSYDPYLIWGKPCKKEDGIKYNYTYSDRLEGTRYASYMERKNPSFIKNALEKELKKEITVHAIAEGANQSNGYEYWVYAFEVSE